MSFNIFGPTQKRDITVGYISTDRGYIQNVSILDANNYAFKNPGTIFIVQTRDGVKYFNINDVNNLKPDDIIPSNTAADGACQGVVGLNPQTIGDAVAIGKRTDGGTLDPGDDKLLVAGDVGVTGSLFVSSSITTQGDIRIPATNKRP